MFQVSLNLVEELGVERAVKIARDVIPNVFAF
jgi:hypothetical protein